MFSILYFFANLSGEGRGEGVKKIENFKSVIDSSVIHRWKAGVLRFLKTCYTICFQFYSILPIYEGVEEGVKKIQNFKIVIDSSVIHHWKAGVLRILKTCHTICFWFCKFLPIYEGGRGGGEKNWKFQNSHRLRRIAQIGGPVAATEHSFLL